MSNKNIYISQHFINEIELNDVTDMLRTEFGFKYELNDDAELDNEFIITNEEALYRTVGHDSSIINISTLINSLETLRNEGSTHVAVDWHCDHLSYDLYGYTVNLAENHEIEEYQNQKKINEEKRKQISELQDRLRQLNNEL